jgi:hypothetical protein
MAFPGRPREEAALRGIAEAEALQTARRPGGGGLSRERDGTRAVAQSLSRCNRRRERVASSVARIVREPGTGQSWRRVCEGSIRKGGILSFFGEGTRYNRWLSKAGAAGRARSSARVEQVPLRKEGRCQVEPGPQPRSCKLLMPVGDLNLTVLVKIQKVFATPTAKNRHLPPRSVSGGHIRVGVGGDPTCPTARAAAGCWGEVHSPLGVLCGLTAHVRAVGLLTAARVLGMPAHER